MLPVKLRVRVYEPSSACISAYEPYSVCTRVYEPFNDMRCWTVRRDMVSVPNSIVLEIASGVMVAAPTVRVGVPMAIVDAMPAGVSATVLARSMSPKATVLSIELGVSDVAPTVRVGLARALVGAIPAGVITPVAVSVGLLTAMALLIASSDKVAIALSSMLASAAVEAMPSRVILVAPAVRDGLAMAAVLAMPASDT